MTSYPTQSLNFLRDVRRGREGGAASHKTKDDATASTKLNVIVVGGGLGGLATSIALARNGHSVTCLEQVSELKEVGAGIQVPPNSNRLLHRWGLEPFLKNNFVESPGITLRRWENGHKIGFTRLIPDFRENFKAPYYVIHRGHFHDALHKCALELGVVVKVTSKVVDYDLEAPSVTLEDGSVVSADLVVGADGVKSLARPKILGGADSLPLINDFFAYRATVDVSKIKADPELAAFLESSPGQNVWVGGDCHVMTYIISGGQKFNMVLSHPAHADSSFGDSGTAIGDMKKRFIGWDSKLTRIISMIESTVKWPLFRGSPLKRWVAPSGKVVILGDAAHPMLPFMSQGAAMAVEDAGALAESLRHMKSKGELSQALSVFERVRQNRTGQMQEASVINAQIWHCADGPKQEARDRAMRAEVEGRHFIWSPNQWSDPTTQCWCYGHDAEEAIREAWKEESQS